MKNLLVAMLSWLSLLAITVHAPAQAAQATFVAIGRVSSVVINTGVLSQFFPIQPRVGDLITYEHTFESATLGDGQLPPNATRYYGAILSSRLTIGANPPFVFPLSGNGAGEANYISVADTLGIYYTIVGSQSPTAHSFSIDFSGGPVGYFPANALPTLPPDIARFARPTFGFAAASGGKLDTVEGILTAISAKTTDFTLVAFDGITQKLVRLDPRTAQVTEIGSLGIPIDIMDGMAFDPAEKVLYAMARGAAGATLLRIDPQTGRATVATPLAFPQDRSSFRDLAFGPGGQLYGLTMGGGNNGNLVRIDKTTGALTEIAFIQSPTGLAYHPSRDAERLFAYSWNFPPNNLLLAITPGSGASEAVGTLTNGSHPLAADPNSTRFFGIGSDCIGCPRYLALLEVGAPNVQIGPISDGIIMAMEVVPVTSSAPPGTAAIAVKAGGSGSGSVTTADGSISCGPVCSAYIAIGSRVRLTATADPDSMFVGWSRAGCTSSRPCSLVVKSDELIVATFVRKPLSSTAKIIYVGVCGAGYLVDDSCLAGQGWYDPREVPSLSAFNPLSESDLDLLAANYSGLDAIALRVGRVFPGSVTLVTGFSVGSVIADLNPFGIRSNVPAIVDLVTEVYRPGDKVYLVGHSSGAAIIQEAAERLHRRDVPVDMTAQIDSVGLFDARVAPNVRVAFNFFYPRLSAVECTVSGESELRRANRRVQTTIINLPIPNPSGPAPADGFCASHKNLDNDPRVWRRVLEFISTGR